MLCPGDQQLFLVLFIYALLSEVWKSKQFVTSDVKPAADSVVNCSWSSSRRYEMRDSFVWGKPPRPEVLKLVLSINYYRG